MSFLLRHPLLSEVHRGTRVTGEQSSVRALVPRTHASDTVFGGISTRRRIRAGVMTGLIGACAGIVMIPVLSILWTALTEGITQLNVYFLTHNMRGVVGGTWPYGGIFHALIGTVEITLATMLICAPLGVATAIFLEEYARGASAGRVATKFANAVSMVVDVMSGIPSILAGLFAYSLFATLGGAGTVNGFVGVVALSVLALPTVVKASQESLRRVPNELRENALALGASRAVMVRKVVVRTALPGLVSAVILAVARIIGETAPLVITAGIVDSTNFNLFSGRMATLPTYIYNEYSQGLATCSTVQMHAANPCLPGIRMERAWAAGLVLVVVVVVLNAIGHAVARKVAVAQK